MRRFLANRIGGIIIVAAFAISASTAFANQDDFAKTEQLFASGASLFNKGQYKDALAKFNEAYSIYPAPNLLFNIARCYQAMGKLQLAIETFKRFLAQPGTEARTKIEANKRIRDLEVAKVESKKAEAARIEAAKRESAKPSKRAVSTAAVDTAADSARKEKATSFSPWQWVAMGAGAALVAGGVVSAVLGFSDINKADEWQQNGVDAEQNKVSPMQVNDLRNQGDTKKLVGFVVGGVGAAALVTGAVLMTLELTGGSKEKKSDDRTAMSFGISPTANGGAAMVTGRF